MRGERPADRILKALRVTIEASDRGKVTIAVLHEAASAADPDYAANPDARDQMAAALNALAAERLIRLPAASELWEKLPTPALPRWVLRQPPDIVPAVAPPRITWHADLGWAAAKYARGDWDGLEVRLLCAANELAIAGGPMRLVPINERSIELLGDEKALAKLSKGRLFGPGRLTLEALGAVRTPPPFPWTRVGDGPYLLVVENTATYWTLARAPRSVDSPLGIVAFGGGQAFVASVDYVRELAGITEVRYFGDFDEEGLRIPAAADGVARRNGLPPVQAAIGLYARLLLANPIRRGRPRSEPEACALARWLPPTLRTRAVPLLLEGAEIPQERIGTDELAGDPSWADEKSLGPAASHGAGS
jgi:hypothetical protein